MLQTGTSNWNSILSNRNVEVFAYHDFIVIVPDIKEFRAILI